MAGYSDVERIAHAEFIMKYPNCPTWTTEAGDVIPFKLLNDDHLKNIIKHLDRRVKSFKDQETRLGIYLGDLIQKANDEIKQLQKLQKQRLISKSPAGKILYG